MFHKITAGGAASVMPNQMIHIKESIETSVHPNSVLKIDRRKTVKRVNEYLQTTYHEYLITLPSNIEPIIIPQYEIRPPNLKRFGHRNNGDGEIASQRADFEDERSRVIMAVLSAAEGLAPEERFVLVYGYLQHKALSDTEMAEELHIKISAVKQLIATEC